jgi:hypothetical protein
VIPGPQASVALQVRARGATLFAVGLDACVMAPKTFARRWAILAAMDRKGDHGGIVFQWSDDWMLGEELQRLLPVGPIPDRLPGLRQPVASVGKCRFAGFFEFRAGVLLGECQEALYDAVAFYASDPLPKS